MNEVPKEFLSMVEKDIERIGQVISSGSPQEQWELFREVDGRYQACIKNWYNSMWGASHDGTHIYYDMVQRDQQSIIENLKYARSKMETYRYQMNAIALPQMPSTNVTVNNNISIGITFEEARRRIDDMTALDDAQADEIKTRISELEVIANESLSRRAKWEKVKPIINSVLKFGADAALTVLQAVLQMKLGV